MFAKPPYIGSWKKGANYVSENENTHEGHRKRMWKKYLEHGIRVFEEHELLEMLLFIMLPRVNTNETAHKLIDRCGSLQGVFTSSLNTLESFKGLGRNSAMLLKFIGDLTNYISCQIPAGIKLNSILDIINFCVERYKSIPYECFSFYLLDRNLTLIYKNDFEIKSKDSCVFDYKEIIKQSTLFNAYAMFLSHNHISGNSYASNHDITVTRTVNTLMNYINVKFIDHIVVQNEQGFSMRKSGELSDIWY